MRAAGDGKTGIPADLLGDPVADLGKRREMACGDGFHLTGDDVHRVNALLPLGDVVVGNECCGIEILQQQDDLILQARLKTLPCQKNKQIIHRRFHAEILHGRTKLRLHGSRQGSKGTAAVLRMIFAR